MAKRAKLNPRQEKFVREFIKTGNGYKSYSKAYGVSPTGNRNIVDASASQLLRNPKVEAAIVATARRALSRHDYTVDTILGELDESRTAAIADKQHGPAVQATTVKARLLGMIVDRKEVGTPGDFAALDSVAAILAHAAKELGVDGATALARLIGAEPPTIDVTPTKIDEENN